MEQQEVEVRLERALDALFDSDWHLLNADASERSISHCLAVHLAHEFPEYNVDCEYNRDGFDVKRLALAQRPASDEDVNAVTVFPDIIVHRRGINDQNLLVIEIKKSSSPISPDYDFLKLNAFRDQLGYRYGVHVILGIGARRVAWV